MAQQNWSAGGGPGVYSQGNTPQLDDINFLSLSGDLDDLFQGAPPLPRLDASSDGFDLLLQRWLQTSGSVPPNAQQQQQQEPGQSYQGYQQFPQSAYSQQQQPPQNTYTQAPPSQGAHPQEVNYQPNYKQEPATQTMYHDHAQMSVSQAPAIDFNYGQGYSQPQPSTAHIQGVLGAELPRNSSPQLSSGTSFSSGAWPSPAGTVGMPSISASGKLQEVSREATPSDNERLDFAQQPAAMPMGADSRTEDAKKAWTQPRRRGPTSEESKEKERARNRRAQKKFREREKERQEQRQNAMATLEAHIASLAKEKADLEARNAMLEQASALRSREEKISSTLGHMDGEFFVEMTHQEPIDLSPILTVRGTPQKLSMADLSKLTFKQHAKIYKEYVDALQDQLEQQPTEAQTKRIIELVRELCAFNLAAAVANPRQYSQFQLSRLDSEEPQPCVAPKSVWLRCLEKLQLSEGQRRELLRDRRIFFTRLSPILKQRWELHRLVEQTLRKDGSRPRESHVKAMEAVEKLRDNLREEQVLLVQSMCAIHQELCLPHQTAANIVYAYPYFPDVPMVVDIIASQTPGEPSTQELLGVDQMPPI